MNPGLNPLLLLWLHLPFTLFASVHISNYVPTIGCSELVSIQIYTAVASATILMLFNVFTCVLGAWSFGVPETVDRNMHDSEAFADASMRGGPCYSANLALYIPLNVPQSADDSSLCTLVQRDTIRVEYSSIEREGERERGREREKEESFDWYTMYYAIWQAPLPSIDRYTNELQMDVNN